MLHNDRENFEQIILKVSEDTALNIDGGNSSIY